MQVKRTIETLTSPRLVIELPESFVNHQVEVLVVTLDEPEPAVTRKRRLPPPQFAGKVKELGDVMSSVSPAEWGVDDRS